MQWRTQDLSQGVVGENFPSSNSKNTTVQEAVSWYRAKYMCIWEGSILLEKPGDNIIIQVLYVLEVLSNFQSELKCTIRHIAFKKNLVGDI